LKVSFTSIKEIVNPIKYQKIQDNISLATGLALITVDFKGVPVTTHSNCSDFCKKIRSSSEYGHYCQKCDSHGALEAVRIQKPYIYICHAGVIDIAIPIIVDDLFLGAFMAGQVLPDKDYSESKLDRIMQGVSNSIDSISDVEIKKAYGALPVMSLEKITALSNMLFDIGNLFIEEAVSKKIISELRSRKNPAEPYKLSENSNDSQYDTGTFNNDSKKILQPALKYIEQNPREKISLAKMAKLCNISASYFSKLFAKENLGNLSDYVNRVKVEHGKKLIESTDLNIRSIANNLGFDDTGYFIKVFKRYTGKTPLEYQKGL